MIGSLDNIGIAVTDLPRMLDFYTNVLGFTTEPGTDDDAWLNLGNARVYLFQTAPRTPDRAVRSDDLYTNPPGIDHLAIRVTDIIGASIELERRGVTFLGEITGLPGDFRYRGFQDPEGNMLYIVQRPVGRRTEPAGSLAADLYRFTQRARLVLSLAQEEAQRFNHNYIGTEHLLLGLVRESDGIAARVLRNLGIQVNVVRNGVEHIIGRGDRIVLGEIGMTPRAKKVIELAASEADTLGHQYIGTEHLLLGLAREGEGIAAGVLDSLGADVATLRQETMRVLNGNGQPPQGPSQQ